MTQKQMQKKEVDPMFQIHTQTQKENDIVKRLWDNFKQTEEQLKNMGKKASEMPYIKHRKELINWLFTVNTRLNLQSITVIKAIGILDLYATLPEVFLTLHKREFNKLGITCLMIASKMEETMRPYLSEILTLSRLRCYNTEIKQTEKKILEALGWDIHFSDANDFITHLTSLGLV